MWLPVTNCLHNVHHKLMWTLSAVLLFLNITAAETEADTLQQISTQEPDATPGCKAPDIRFSVFKPETTTEQPFAHFETTQVYLSEDFTTADIEFIERINIDLTGIHSAQMGDNVNPYQVDLDRDHKVGADITSTIDRNKDNVEIFGKQSNKAISKNNKNLSVDDGRNEKDQSRVHSRYKRQLHIQYNSNLLKDYSGNELIPGVDVYYIDIKDILKSLSSKNKFQYKLYKLKNGKINANRGTNKKNYVRLKILSEDEKNKSRNKEQQQEWKYHLELKQWNNKDIKKNAKDESIEYRKYQQQYPPNKKKGGTNIHEVFIQGKRDLFKHMLRRSMQRYKQNNITKLTYNYHNIQNDINNEQNNGSELTFTFDKKNVNNFEVGGTKKPPLWRTKEVDDYAHLHSISKINALQRVKRKSGKTTGALSRPKGGSDSGSKTTSRKDKDHMLVEMYGDDVPSSTTCKERFRRLKDDDFDTEDKEHRKPSKKF